MPFEYCSSLTFHSTSRSARSLFVLEFCGILEFEMLQTHIFYSVLKMDFLNWMLCLQKVDNTSFKWEGHLIFLHFSQMINSIKQLQSLQYICTACTWLLCPQSCVLMKMCLTQLYSLKFTSFSFFYFSWDIYMETQYIIELWNVMYFLKVRKRKLQMCALH